MSRHEANREKPCPDESRLKSLQTDLAKSNRTYKYQKNKFEQLKAKASQIKQSNQNNLKPQQKPSPITFRKQSTINPPNLNSKK